MDWEAQIQPFDTGAAARCKTRWDNVAKPLASLGLLEDALIAIAGLTGSENYTIEKRALLVLAADNGVVAQGVTQTGSEVTAALVRSLARGSITVCKMAALAHTDVFGVDMGILEDLHLERQGIQNRRIAAGTEDISKGPAMSREQALLAIGHGIELVAQKKREGYKILATGEVGIGNTTTSSAVASVLLSRPAEEMTGRGAGLSGKGLLRKIETIKTAITVNAPNPADALDVLAKLGGFDIAGLCGVFIGGAIHRVPILVDGFISSVAALAAVGMCPPARQAMLASHVSAEPAGALVLQALDLKPLICAGMCLGEGTGAVAALPLLDMAYAVYGEMDSFDEMQIEKYQPLS